mmetsp:Transcript_34262/g.50853  ORF Transcript_34262/g.50853 Transcript_34262/m.50853 type:complete len:147 (-) Transcript_34262:658-1098(-)
METNHGTKCSVVMSTFTTREILRRRRLKSSKKKGEGGGEEVTILENMAIGMSSALVAGLLTQPVDVVKTRMMTQAASAAVPYTSALDCVSTILRTEGVFTLYAGLRQRATYMCLLWGVTFALNGQIQTKLSSMQRRRRRAEQQQLQ